MNELMYIFGFIAIGAFFSMVSEIIYFKTKIDHPILNYIILFRKEKKKWGKDDL